MDFNIHVKKENRDLPVSPDKLGKLSSAAFKLTGKKPGDISLVVCGDSFIQELNRKYRGVNNPTDVLSFSMREGEVFDYEENILGDIVISVDSARRHAGIHIDFEVDKTYLDESNKDRSFQEEFLFLFTHGLLHLLGYTHGEPKSEKKMMNQVKKILSGVVQTK